MISLDILKQLVSDRDLQGQVARLLTNKVRADVQALEVNSLLSRHLFENAAKAQRGDAVPNDREVRGLVKEHLDFYESMLDQALAFHQRLKARLSNLRSYVDVQRTIETLKISGPVNSAARGRFRIENNNEHSITVSFELTPFRAELSNELVSTSVAFDPPLVELKPNQEARVECIVAVSDNFAPGCVYIARMNVKGLEGTELWVRLLVGEKETSAARTPMSGESRPHPTDSDELRAAPESMRAASHSAKTARSTTEVVKRRGSAKASVTRRGKRKK